MAAFRDPEQLRGALDELVFEAFTRAQLWLVSSPSALDAITSQPDALYSAVHLVDDVGGLTDLPGAGYGALMTTAADDDPDRAKFSVSQRLLANFKPQIAEGALVLIVSSATPNQQDRASKILLQHSSTAITIHEFTRLHSRSSGCICAAGPRREAKKKH